MHTSRMASCDLYVVPHWSLAGALHAKDIYWWEFPANIEVSSSQERDEGYTDSTCSDMTIVECFVSVARVDIQYKELQKEAPGDMDEVSSTCYF